jgi:hypothetical protein
MRETIKHMSRRSGHGAGRGRVYTHRPQLTSNTPFWYGHNNNVNGVVYILRFAANFFKNQTYQNFTDDLTRCLQDHEAGRHSYTRNQGLFNPAFWVENVPAKRLHEATDANDSYYKMLIVCHNMNIPFNDLSLTHKRITKLLYTLQLPEFQNLPNVKIHSHSDLPHILRTLIPPNMQLIEYPCPWSSTPLPPIPPDILKKQTEAIERRNIRIAEIMAQSDVKHVHSDTEVALDEHIDDMPTDTPLLESYVESKRDERVFAENNDTLYLDDLANTAKKSIAENSQIVIDNLIQTIKKSQPTEVQQLSIQLHKERQEKLELILKHDLLTIELQKMKLAANTANADIKERTTNQDLIDKVSAQGKELEKQITDLKTLIKPTPNDKGIAGENEIEQFLRNTVGTFMDVQNVSKIRQGHEMDLELISLDRTVKIRVDVKNTNANLLAEPEIAKFYNDIDDLKPPAAGAILFMKSAVRGENNLVKSSRRGSTLVYEIGCWANHLLIESILHIYMTHKHLNKQTKPNNIEDELQFTKVIRNLCELVSTLNDQDNNINKLITNAVKISAEKTRETTEILRNAHSINPAIVPTILLKEFEKNIPKRLRGGIPNIKNIKRKTNINKPNKPNKKRKTNDSLSDSETE